MTNPLQDRAADAFATTLAELRSQRGLSKKQLAAEMGFDPSYVSHVEARRHRPTEDFARRAELALRAGGAVWQRFREYEEARNGAARGTPRDPPVPDQWVPTGAGLIVEYEDTNVSYMDGIYTCTVRRCLCNAGTDPVTRYLIRIAVDRFPGDPDRSAKHHREHPLTWPELALTARCGDEPMVWREKLDRDAIKEVWLLFENDETRFPLYPGERCTVEYGYRIGEEKSGQWFQRAIRLPTRRLTIGLDFPAGKNPTVWGMETSLTAEAGPLPTPVRQRTEGGRSQFEWAADAPTLNARYRLEWRFRERGTAAGTRLAMPGHRSSDRMRDAGIVQIGASVLTRTARWFDLPGQESLAREIVARLLDALDRVSELHHFGKGVGLAAPQLGIGWAAAVIRPAGPEPVPIVLLNPKVINSSTEQDEQYEGCLSFFDDRGLVPRSLVIDVEHADLSGGRAVTTFSRALARLAAHEVDHLEGVLYPDRLPAGERLLSVDEYNEHAMPWRY
jgi:peptide deformylase